MEEKQCKHCGSKLINESSSTHVWKEDYECGYSIWGALDVTTHGIGEEVYNKCKNDDRE